MRQLARFEEEDTAQTLGDALYIEGIDSRVDSTREGGWLLWVHDEAHLARAQELLALFEQAPDDIRFKKAKREAAVRRKTGAREEKKARPRTVDVRKRWQGQGSIGPFTLGVIIVSVGVFLLTWEELGGGERVSRWLYIDSQPPLSSVLYGLFQDVRSGQVWRLFTPVLMHGGFFHLLFNMWWLKDLGTMIERRQSTRLLVVMFFAVALVSNVAQYLVSGPYFVGMSGVVYGLFGYIWVRGRLDPSSGMGLTPFAVLIMMGFFVLCWTGLMGPIANVAHTGGLVTGAIWGLAAAKLKR